MALRIRADRRRERTRDVPRDLLLAAPRPGARVDGGRAGAFCRRRLGRPVRRVGRALSLGADLREPRRADGCQQPAPAWADLGDQLAATRGRTRRLGAASLRRVEWATPAARLR